MISVCIATHNGAKFIFNQINSILEQISDEDEIIISDDGSIDNTLEIIKSIKDSRLKLYHCVHHKVKSKHSAFYYASSNFENALKEAKGDYIFLCDQDDIWYPNKIKTCLQYLDEFDCIKHNYSTINKNGEIIEISKYKPSTHRNWNFLFCLKYLPFRGCCMAFKRKVILEALPFPNNCFQHDSWIGMVALIKGFSFHFIDQPLIYHRIHGDNVSELLTPNTIIFKIKYRLTLVKQLMIRKFNRNFSPNYFSL